MTVAVPRTYVDGTTLVKEWGISNSTLEVRRAGAVVAGGVDAVGGGGAMVLVLMSCLMLSLWLFDDDADSK